MGYLADQAAPAMPKPAEPRLRAAIKAAYAAHKAIIREEDVSEEVIELVKTMSDELNKMVDIYREEYEYERWWDYTYYYRLNGRHMEEFSRQAEEHPKQGEVIDFTEAVLRKAQKE